MEITLINGEVGFAGQLTDQNITELAQQGVKTFICNRPDAEDAGQPDRATLEKAARDAGAKFHYLPLIAGTPPSPELLQQYADVYREAEKPVISFCRTGRRSSIIHEGAQPLL